MTTELIETESRDAAQKRNLIDALYRKYNQALRRFLARQHLGRDEVADIVQETYYRVHQSGNVDAIRNPKAFLFRVANNVRLNEKKHRASGVEEHALDVERLEIETDDPSPYRRCKGEQELAIVRAALAELAPKCREAFVMNRFENLTFVQIAGELQLSVSMVEKHVSHAIAHMRNRLDDAQPSPGFMLRVLK